MRFIEYLAVLGIVIALAVWLIQRGTGRTRERALEQAPGDLRAQAAMVSGPERGAGSLRLTPTQLVFTAASGRMLVIERAEIVGAGVTRETPTGRSASTLLVITTDADGFYFLLDDPQEWVSRLLR